MITYNNTLIEYFKANDTEFKKLLNKEFEKSRLASFIQFMDSFFCKLGLISVNIKPIENARWDSLYTLSPENIFSQEFGSILVTNTPLPRKEAEEKLSEVVIELLSIVNINEVKKQII
ncbi:MAG: hypothetical protein HRT69_07155 [Flavobacteriaceae bacterium]|nr:hypothetical protein [Flavobacteriaceae bacterium]